MGMDIFLKIGIGNGMTDFKIQKSIATACPQTFLSLLSSCVNSVCVWRWTTRRTPCMIPPHNGKLLLQPRTVLFSLNSHDNSHRVHRSPVTFSLLKKNAHSRRISVPLPFSLQLTLQALERHDYNRSPNSFLIGPIMKRGHLLSSSPEV